MELTDTVVVRNSSGVIQSGLSLTWYKHGITTGGIAGTEDTGNAGKYTVTIPDTSLARTYDIRISGGDDNPYISDRFIGEWKWLVRSYSATDGATVSFSDLTDVSGDALPATIPNACIQVLNKDDRLVYIDNITTTGFDIHLSVAGSSDHYIDLEITLGA